MLPPEKDDTDTGWAVKEGWKRGYREFVLYGVTGGRISHTMANVQLLAGLAVKGGHGILVGEGVWYRVIYNEEIVLEKRKKAICQCFVWGMRLLGFVRKGLKYELDHAKLTKEYPVGVSNEFIGKESSVAVREGMLLLIWEKKGE